jgi:hypothetical protein
VRFNGSRTGSDRILTRIALCTRSGRRPASRSPAVARLQYLRYEGSVVRLYDASCRELSTPAPGPQCWRRTMDWRSSALPMVFGAEFFELCPHEAKPQ